MKNNSKIMVPLDEFIATGRNRAVVEWAVNKLSESGSLCDLGCGYGWLAESIQKRLPKAIVVGIDQDEKIIELVRHNSCSRTRFITTNEIIGGEWHNFFDISIATETIEHVVLGERGRFLIEMYESLKPGGIGLITTPASNLRSKAFDPAYWLVRHHHFKLNEIVKLITDAGFSINHISQRGRWWEVLSLWDLYASKWILQRRPILTRFFNAKLDEEWNREKPGWSCWWIEVQRP